MSLPPDLHNRMEALWRECQHATRSWFYLTRQERVAVLVVLGLFLLGVTAKLYLQTS